MGAAALLAHEIKNPLSGIRGAAQLLEQNITDDDRVLTQLICSETERIRNLVDRMEVFGDRRPLYSGEFTLGQSEQVDLDVTGVLRLRLTATLTSTSNGRVQAVWGDARLTT